MILMNLTVPRHKII
uniref:Uncharacterized protein n=1 Tax=Anguilla anguilla TaxID=7936 RepID=A0A0E9U154_ANGAN